MLFKVFYQERKDSTPRRESTRTLYVDIDTTDQLEGTIKLRELIAKKTDYRIELIDRLSDAAAAYEKKHRNFKLTKF